MKLTIQDQKDLNKFMRFFALKATQLIVQSRGGQKDCTPCKQHTSGSDWFNLNIQDIPEILTETRNVLKNDIIPSSISRDYPLCIEISLRTAEGDVMCLETWSMSLLPEECDVSPRIMSTVYSRMGLLLKSLVSITRVVPAYKLSRRQSPDSYIVCYRISMETPQVHLLGEDFNQVRVGQICTPIGTLQLSLAYRTKMTISPTQSGRENSIMVKSDHFNTNSSPNEQKMEKQDETQEDILNRPLPLPAFVDPIRAAESYERLRKLKSFSEYEITPEMRALFERKRPKESIFKSATVMPEIEHTVVSINTSSNSSLNSTSQHDSNGNSGSKDDARYKNKDITMESTNDDYVMKTPPFARRKDTLSQFYTQFQNAEVLNLNETPTFSKQFPDKDSMDDFFGKLTEKGKEFNNFVDKMNAVSLELKED